jgi:hypothetical protein
MTSDARTSISAFPRGHEFPSARFALGAEAVAAYLRSVGDESDYRGCVPPLAAVTFGLGAFQAHISLPDGSLHTGQEVEQRGLLRDGGELKLTGRIAQRSERQGFVITVLEFEIGGEGEPAVRARATIMAPAAAE